MTSANFDVAITIFLLNSLIFLRFVTSDMNIWIFRYNFAARLIVEIIPLFDSVMISFFGTDKMGKMLQLELIWQCLHLILQLA